MNKIKTNAITNFIVFIEASISPNDRRVLNIVVRSWENLQNFDKVGPDDVEYNRSAYAHSSSPSFLAPRKDCYVWKVGIGFEAEQACALAMTHIQSRRYLLH